MACGWADAVNAGVWHLWQIRDNHRRLVFPVIRHAINFRAILQRGLGGSIYPGSKTRHGETVGNFLTTVSKPLIPLSFGI